MKRVAWLIPCLNEAPTIGPLVRQIRQKSPDTPIYVYDNGSTDQTRERAIEAGAIVRGASPRGKGRVVREMFADVDEDIVILIDGDGTYSVDDWRSLVDPIEAGHADMVVGARLRHADEGSLRPSHVAGNRFLTGLVNLLFGSRLTDVLSGYRALHRRVYKALPLRADGFELEVEMTVRALESGFAVAEIQSPYHSRPEGSVSKLNTITDGIRVQLTLMKLFAGGVTRRIRDFVDRHPWTLPVSFGIVAAVLRVIFVYQSTPFATIDPPQPGLDTDLHWRVAKMIRLGAGDPPHFEAMALSSPLYAYWIALCQSVLGEKLFAHRILGALLGGVTVGLVVHSATRLGSRLAAAIVGLILAWLPSLILMDTKVMKTSLEILLLAGLLASALAFRDAKTPATRRYLGLGIGAMLAVLYLLQLITLLWVFPISFFLLLYWMDSAEYGVSSFTEWLPGLSVFVVTVALAVGFAPSGPNAWFQPRSGFDVRVGFNPLATGAYRRIEQVAASPIGHTFDARIQAEVELKRPLTFEEANRHHWHRAIQFIIDNPGDATALVARKLQLFFNRYEARTEDSVDVLNRRFDLMGLSPFGFGWLVVFGMVGMATLAVQRRRRVQALLSGMVASVLIPTLLGFVTWRFRLPAVIPLALLSVIGIDALRALRFDLPSAVRVGAVAVGLGLVLAPVVDERTRTLYNQISALNERAAYRLLSHKRELASTDPIPLSEIPSLIERNEHTRAFRALAPHVPAGAEDAWANAAYLKYLLWASRREDVRTFLSKLQTKGSAVTQKTNAELSPLYRNALDRMSVALPTIED